MYSSRSHTGIHTLHGWVRSPEQPSALPPALFDPSNCQNSVLCSFRQRPRVLSSPIHILQLCPQRESESRRITGVCLSLMRLQFPLFLKATSAATHGHRYPPPRPTAERRSQAKRKRQRKSFALCSGVLGFHTVDGEKGKIHPMKVGLSSLLTLVWFKCERA